MVDMKKNYKKGFSLVGVIMILLLVFFIMMITIPLVTKKHQLSTNNGENANGMYICYKAEPCNKEGKCTIYQQYFSNGNIVKAAESCIEGSADCRCNFEAPANVERINIQLVGGGGGGAGIRNKRYKLARQFNYWVI